MIGYAIITLLALALLFQVWRKRVWKRRAGGVYLWAAFWKGFWDEWRKQRAQTKAPTGVDTSQFLLRMGQPDPNCGWIKDAWPAVINDK